MAILTWGTALLSTCAEAALVVTDLLAATRGATGRPARTGTALEIRRARENISSVVEAEDCGN